MRPEFRGRGVVAAIVAEICAQAHRGGADNEEVAALYERVATGWPARQCYLSAEAFRAFGELAGLPLRRIVRGIPPPALNKVPLRKRTP